MTWRSCSNVLRTAYFNWSFTLHVMSWEHPDGLAEVISRCLSRIFWLVVPSPMALFTGHTFYRPTNSIKALKDTIWLENANFFQSCINEQWQYWPMKGVKPKVRKVVSLPRNISTMGHTLCHILHPKAQNWHMHALWVQYIDWKLNIVVIHCKCRLM